MLDNLTFVVIGKNEALNLPRCFRSIQKVSNKIIFVDSNSDDNSIEVATQHKIKTILRVKSNFGTPALSRSIGAKNAQTKYIQFVDGDMEIEMGWAQKAIQKLESNKKIVAVHGYKKVYTKNHQDYFILSDSKDWQADYLQGAFLIERKIYNRAGGLDGRFYGEEERDLYIRIKAIGYEVWYIHDLMASHYDLKKKTINRILFGDPCATIWVPLIKAIKARSLISYLFVYRALLFPLLLDIISIFSIFFSFMKFVLIVIILQFVELVYCLLINRKGYFMIWKVAFINFYRVIKIYKRKIVYSVETL